MNTHCSGRYARINAPNLICFVARPMTTRSQDTLFEKYLAPILGLFVDYSDIAAFRESIDWPTAVRTLENPTLTYPDYYLNGRFHGIEGGYLTVDAATSYDPITRYAVPPHETWIRQHVIEAIPEGLQPRRILDLGCGTGSTTVLLKEAYPDADVIGLDLSPYMLVVAERKSHQLGLPVQWIHGDAERTGLMEGSFDIVTASLLCHELPPAISRRVLMEAHRLLKAGGMVLILDGNQKMLQQTEWLMTIFEEPYIQAYATSSSVDAWMGAAGFGSVHTQDIWGIHQLSQGIKPVLSQDPDEWVMPTVETLTPVAV